MTTRQPFIFYSSSATHSSFTVLTIAIQEDMMKKLNTAVKDSYVKECKEHNNAWDTEPGEGQWEHKHPQCFTATARAHQKSFILSVRQAQKTLCLEQQGSSGLS